ncbi:hypothetical protein ASPVEDRAFT_439523 [Aspergillus versicolor CBS 583.65]|uniref:Uncharacterized protein n=1 Tax=Aspergillus versicolor CBS 583.65 TaxID=1036611 RepID=A0A1L9P8T9_ASPVE|nr:uncharacterized protein ASPVEDRAFT_439523 [Aspergillus versicolor CBS 583.65]OJI97950.1 hypothetical protein ASPVEDRAFT_439523 [Aspergillus versicolor CBS 583.65]
MGYCAPGWCDELKSKSKMCCVEEVAKPKGESQQHQIHSLTFYFSPALCFFSLFHFVTIIIIVLPWASGNIYIYLLFICSVFLARVVRALDS